MRSKVLFIVVGVMLVGCQEAGPNERIIPETAPKALGVIAKQTATPSQKQIEDFGSLAKYVGNAYRGAPTDGSTEKFVDIQKWEWALGGNAILIRHALEGGSYGGDTYVYKDGKTGQLVYVYITNAGYHTVGEMQPTDSGWISEEAVNGHETITRVRSTSTVDEEGIWSMTSEYLTDGEWVPGHSFEYALTDDPLPVLQAAE